MRAPVWGTRRRGRASRFPVQFKAVFGGHLLSWRGGVTLEAALSSFKTIGNRMNTHRKIEKLSNIFLAVVGVHIPF